MNGSKRDSRNHYVIVNVETGEFVRTPAFEIGPWRRGELRIDAAPTWRRDGRAIALPALAQDGTRQTWVIHMIPPAH